MTKDELHAAIVECLTTKPIMELEQGRSFPMTKSEANYAARCLILGPLSTLVDPA